MPESSQPPLTWNEETTRLYLDFGRYIIPDREEQIQMICSLIPPTEGPFHVLELCCGEGLLAGAVLEQYPDASLHALDGSAEMLAHARQNLASWGSRFSAAQFSLQDSAWRSLTSPMCILPEPARAVISSMAIHHLTGEEKAGLYRDLFGLLAPGGALIIADIIAPVDPHWQAVTAAQLDEVVRQRANAIDGSLLAFDYFQNEHWNIYHFPDDMDKPSPIFDQLRWLNEAGFIHVDVFWMKAGHAIYGGLRPPA